VILWQLKIEYSECTTYVAVINIKQAKSFELINYFYFIFIIGSICLREQPWSRG